MATDIINKIEREQINTDVNTFNVGDTVKVHCRVVEGGKERIQIFEGICIARRGSLINESFTVRKISNGEGVERTFNVHSPLIKSITVKRSGKVRQAKLYYIRDLTAKKARIAEKRKVKKAAEAKKKGLKKLLNFI